MMLVQAMSEVAWLRDLQHGLCVCGRCSERLSARASELRTHAKRLSAASFRAREASHLRRAEAYAAQSRAARLEARQCERLADAPRSPAVERFVAAVSGIINFVVTPECTRLPQKWPKQFI